MDYQDLEPVHFLVRSIRALQVYDYRTQNESIMCTNLIIGGRDNGVGQVKQGRGDLSIHRCPVFTRRRRAGHITRSLCFLFTTSGPLSFTSLLPGLQFPNTQSMIEAWVDGLEGGGLTQTIEEILRMRGAPMRSGWRSKHRCHTG